ncbi:MAG: DUF2029 domain-containing protein [Caldilineaceae bacterium]|nr:DUF2029 domain-containing protein [Caldilineaceae bacterium]
MTGSLFGSADRAWLGWRLLLLGLAIWSVLSLARTVLRIQGPIGATDFHSYWYYGHFLWQEQDPYLAFARGEQLALPIQYADGVTVERQPVAQPELATTPANTAPLLLLLSTLSVFSWPVAKTAWLILNVLLIVVIPWLVLGLLPQPKALPPHIQWLVALLFYSLKLPRAVAWLGQTSLLILTFMLLTLLLRNRTMWLAGLLFGLALSKYSLSFPVLILLLFTRHFGIVIIGLLTQAAGLLLVSFIGHSSILDIARVYVNMVTLHADYPGIHIAYQLGDDSLIGMSIVVGGTLLVGWFLWQWWRRHQVIRQIDLLPLLTVLSLWTLLAAYHRNYDSILVVFFVTLSIAAQSTWLLSRGEALFLATFLVVSLLVINAPGELITPFLPTHLSRLWDPTLEKLLTATLVAMLAISVWLLFRIPRDDEHGEGREAHGSA